MVTRLDLILSGFVGGPLRIASSQRGDWHRSVLPHSLGGANRRRSC